MKAREHRRMSYARATRRVMVDWTELALVMLNGGKKWRLLSRRLRADGWLVLSYSRR